MEKKESWLNRSKAGKRSIRLDETKGETRCRPEDILETINEVFKEDDKIAVTDVGQHQMFTSQYLEVNEKTRLYMSGGLGNHGIWIPGAVGAQIGNPDSTVIAISGDGGMQMNIQEFANSSAGRTLILCVFNNTYLGMVRQWQKLSMEKRYSYDGPRRRSMEDGGRASTSKYTPDFLKPWQKARGARNRVNGKIWMKQHFEQAKSGNRALKRPTPTLIES